MKFLIWFLCIMVCGLVQAGLSSAGITLGAIPTVLLFAGMSALARALCKNRDERQMRKASQKYEKDLAASGLSRFEFAQSRMTATSREFCDKHIQEPKVLEKYFNQLVSSRTITHEESRVLLHGYEKLAKEAAAAREKEAAVHPESGKWFCTECGTPCFGDRCPKCGLSKHAAFSPDIASNEEALPGVAVPAALGGTAVLDHISLTEIAGNAQPEETPEAKEEAFPETVRIAPPVLFEEPAQSRWFCTECGTPCQGDACPNCGMTKARAFGLEPVAETPVEAAPVEEAPAEELPVTLPEPIPEPQEEAFPETVRIAPPVLFEEPAQNRWFCTECGTPCEGDACPNCGMTHAKAFGLEPVEEVPAAPVEEPPVAEAIPEVIPEPAPIVPPALFEEPAQSRWFCTECGTPCEGDACPNCGMTRARAFGLEPVEETPVEAAPVEEAPVEEPPVAEVIPEVIPEPAPIVPPVLFEEPAQSRWFCTECGTPCQGDACPNCGMTRAKAFGLEPVEEIPEPPAEVIPEIPAEEETPVVPEIPEAPQAETADLEQPHWFCIACGTFCQGETCPSCGTTRAEAFGLEETEEKPLEPVFEVPVPEAEPEEIPLFTLETQPEPAPEPPVAVPRYVKLTEQWEQSGWKVFDYLFVTYDHDFALSCAQAIMDEAGRVDNATRIPLPGAPEEDVTQLLMGCGRNIRQCPAFAGGSAGLGIGVMTQGMTVKTFLNPGTNRITVMAYGASDQEPVSNYLNSIIHMALRG